MTRGATMAFLLSLLLVAQLAGPSAHGFAAHGFPAYGVSSYDGAGATAAAQETGLSAAIGQPVVLCLHDDPTAPTPATPADCDRCTLCTIMAGGLLPTAIVVPVPDAIIVRPLHPDRAATAPAVRRAGHASPRGPPILV